MFRPKEHLIRFLESILLAKGARTGSLRDIVVDFDRLAPFVSSLQDHYKGPITNHLA